MKPPFQLAPPPPGGAFFDSVLGHSEFDRYGLSKGMEAEAMFKKYLAYFRNLQSRSRG